MSKRAFGGRPRLDKLDLMSLLKPNDPAEKIIFLHTIVDALNNYLYFGLAARNGTTAAEFWYDHEYFFRVRSYERATWENTANVKVTAVDEISGHRKTTNQKLTDEQLMAMCFDTHFHLVDIKISLNRFLKMLKSTRNDIINENWEQINAYLTSLELKSYPSSPNPFPLSIEEKKRILLSPENPEEVAKLICLRETNSNQIPEEEIIDETDSEDSGDHFCSRAC